MHCLHLQVGAFTRRLDKEKGESIYPENGCLGLFKVVFAGAELVTGTLDRGDNMICLLSMILVKTVINYTVIPVKIRPIIRYNLTYSFRIALGRIRTQLVFSN